MSRSIDNTKFIDFSCQLPNSPSCSINHVKLDRFCREILPQIQHNVIGLTVDKFSMGRVLLAGEYPNLSVIVFDNFLPDIFLRNLSGKV